MLVSERYPIDTRQACRRRGGGGQGPTRRAGSNATTDGFALAELDLEQRREGELLGLTQSGLPPLRVASLSQAAGPGACRFARAQLAEQIVDADGRLGPDLADLQHEITRWLARAASARARSWRADADA